MGLSNVLFFWMSDLHVHVLVYSQFPPVIGNGTSTALLTNKK